MNLQIRLLYIAICITIKQLILDFLKINRYTKNQILILSTLLIILTIQIYYLIDLVKLRRLQNRPPPIIVVSIRLLPYIPTGLNVKYLIDDLPPIQVS